VTRCWAIHPPDRRSIHLYGHGPPRHEPPVQRRRQDAQQWGQGRRPGHIDLDGTPAEAVERGSRDLLGGGSEGPGIGPPVVRSTATLARTSTRPQSFSMPVSSARYASASARSHGRAVIPGTSYRGSAWTSTPKTRAPRAARSRAIWFPIPDAAPVTMAIWPSKRCTGLLMAGRQPVRAVPPATIYRSPGDHSAESSCSPNHHAASRQGTSRRPVPNGCLPQMPPRCRRRT